MLPLGIVLLVLLAMPWFVGPAAAVVARHCRADFVHHSWSFCACIKPPRTPTNCWGVRRTELCMARREGDPDLCRVNWPTTRYWNPITSAQAYATIHEQAMQLATLEKRQERESWRPSIFCRSVETECWNPQEESGCGGRHRQAEQGAVYQKQWHVRRAHGMRLFRRCGKLLERCCANCHETSDPRTIHPRGRPNIHQRQLIQRRCIHKSKKRLECKRRAPALNGPWNPNSPFSEKPPTFESTE